MTSPEAGLKLPPVTLSKGKESLSTDLKRKLKIPSSAEEPSFFYRIHFNGDIVAGGGLHLEGTVDSGDPWNRQFTIIKKRRESQIEGVVAFLDSVLSITSEYFCKTIIVR